MKHADHRPSIEAARLTTHVAARRLKAAYLLCRVLLTVAGSVCLFGLAAPAYAAALAVPPVPGSFDTSFGNGVGKVLQMAVTADGPDVMTAIAAQADGKTVVAGYCGAVRVKFCVARFDNVGALDQTFAGENGDAGKFTINVPEWRYAAAMSVSIQSDAKLLVAGVCDAGGQFMFCLLRLLPDGRLDPSFVGPTGASRGAASIPQPMSANFLTALTVQNDGNILLAGVCALSNPRRDATCLARLLPDGAWDTSFTGPDGNAGGAFVVPLTDTYERRISTVTQPDMKIILVAGCGLANENKVCVARLNRNGSFDPSFNALGTPGRVNFLTFANVNVTPVDIALQPDGKLLIVGNCELGLVKVCIARITPQGSFDRTFIGSGGGNGSFFLSASSGDDYAHTVKIQIDGKIVLGVRCVVVSSRLGDLCMARLHGDGTLDTSFDGPDLINRGNGIFALKMELHIGSNVSTLLQRDGQILHVSTCAALPGVSVERVCLARIHGGPHAGPRCTMDIDGDGIAGSPTDATIAIRAAMGFAGAALIAGVDIPVHASRRSPSSIYEYLTTQCAMPIEPFRSVE
jgi:uncharacterized delta-60 repeat protein